MSTASSKLDAGEVAVGARVKSCYMIIII